MEAFVGEEPGNELEYAVSTGEVWGGTSVGKKRSRCLYLPDDKSNLESSDVPPELLGVPPYLFKIDNNPGIADDKASSISAKYDSFAADFEDPWIIETTQDSSDLKEKKTKLKAFDLNRRPFVLPCGKKNIVLKNIELDINDALNINADREDQNTDEFDTQTGEKVEFEEGKLAESSIVALMEDTGRHMTDIMETVLFDAHLTVKASFREEHVPFVCLTSHGNGKPILGYPLEVGTLSDGCNTFLPFYNRGSSRFHRLVWRTSRRTPVCYVTNSHFYTISKNVRNKREKLPKNPCHSKKAEVVLTRACVPVEYIFGKILKAVGNVRS
ncbi:uncharacterized protein [Primulina huaijiensis]|uniref:uncharacterized protein isoform X1 n=1 Tax=Primulina huaijiensis TaxID=1492673 RepID=UPI003CC77064